MALRIPDPDDGAVFALDAHDGAADEVDAAVEVDALQYADTVSALAEVVASPPVLGLRSRILASAFADRAPGASIDDGGADDAPLAFARTARDLDSLLAGLADDDWLEPAHAEIGCVRDVVAHLLAIESYVLAQLTDPGRALEHVGHLDTGATAVAAVGGLAVGDLAVGELRTRWREAADALATAAQQAPADTVVQLHSLPVGIEGAMFMRTFELWAHLDDIARATGRRRPRLDARRMRAMSTALVEALPVAMAVSGHADVTARARLVITGPGGGAHDLVFGAAADSSTTTVPVTTVPVTTVPVTTVTVDVVDLCRLAARRARASQLDLRVDGDRTVADALLASASAFAMD